MHMREGSQGVRPITQVGGPQRSVCIAALVQAINRPPNAMHNQPQDWPNWVEVSRWLMVEGLRHMRGALRPGGQHLCLGCWQMRRDRFR